MADFYLNFILCNLIWTQLERRPQKNGRRPKKNGRQPKKNENGR
jgi:hypothetical protein